MKTCIICNKEKEEIQFNIEHVIPESIGGALTINSVCTDCNSRLGTEVDIHLINHLTVRDSCFNHKIRNKDGKVPEPSISNGFLDKDQRQRVKYKFDEDGKPIEVFRTPYVEKDFKSGKVKIILDVKDKDNLQTILNKITDRNKLPRISKEDIEKNSFTGTVEKPIIHVSNYFDIVQFHRGFFKIIYELAWLWLGNEYLKDETGKIIKECMFDNNLTKDYYKKYPIKGNLNFITEKSLFMNYDELGYCHTAIMIDDLDRIIINLKVLDVLEGTVVISNRRSNYIEYENKYLSINPLTKEILLCPLHQRIMEINQKSNKETI